jgi:hypothetical protein
MKTNRLFLAAAVLLAVTLSGCVFSGRVRGNGDIVSLERNVTGFDGIDLQGAGIVNVYQSGNYRIVVTTDSNIQDYIAVEKTGNLLRVGQKDGANITWTKFTIDVYMPELKSVSVEGAGKITVAQGRTPALKINLSGAAEIDTQDYEAQTVDVLLSGAGTVKTWAASALNYQISGLGSVKFRGSPVLKGNISGLGTIRPL